MKSIISLPVAFLFFCVFSVSASAATAPAVQPDNGFYKGADPEWSTLHATDQRGTVEHREYHRAASQAHVKWHEDYKSAQSNLDTFEEMHRVFHQERNTDHRMFHSGPTPATPSTGSTAPTGVTVTNEPQASAGHTYTGTRPTRRSILEAAQEQNAARIGE